MTDISELAHCESTVQARERLGEILGIGRPVSEAVLVSALEDDSYARYLMGSRNAPEVMEMLLANPSIKVTTADEVAFHGTPELLMKAAQAFARWTHNGLRRVDDETYSRRLAACRVCEYFTPPPDRMIYRLASGLSQEKYICSLCGCLAATKARMISESCPAPDPLHPELSRWHEANAK